MTEILIRDNIGKLKFERNKPCSVSWGRWICPYTGKTLTKASDVDVDHVVPLAHAYETGGKDWTREQKQLFANDPDNLLTVCKKANEQKGDKSPVEWKPPLRKYWPDYAAKWQTIKKKYGLVLSPEEAKALQQMIGSNR